MAIERKDYLWGTGVLAGVFATAAAGVFAYWGSQVSSEVAHDWREIAGMTVHYRVLDRNVPSVFGRTVLYSYDDRKTFVTKDAFRDHLEEKVNEAELEILSK